MDNILPLLITVFLGVGITLQVIVLFPESVERLRLWREKKEKAVDKEIDKMFYAISRKQVLRLYYISPLIGGISGFLLGKSFVFAGVGAVFFFFAIPTMFLKIKDSARRGKFNKQILDAIMLLSSSLKGGLSLLQAIETLVEEMPAPINQEFNLVLRENKMGITLEQTLLNLNKRMKMADLELVINSILVARETGGDLTKVFNRLTTTIRDNNKLQDNIKTLTMQGRLQGLIMSILPFVFVWWTATFNKGHFDIMFTNETGRLLIFVAVFLQFIGMFLIRKFSTIKF